MVPMSITKNKVATTLNKPLCMMLYRHPKGTQTDFSTHRAMQSTSAGMSHKEHLRVLAKARNRGAPLCCAIRKVGGAQSST